MSGEKVVVTGGAGFIGSHLAEELARRGYHVFILDNLSTGKQKNIEWAHGKGNVELILGSITDLPLLRQLFHGVEYVFHMAAMTSVPLSLENPQASHEANATGTLNVLLAARDNAVKRVIYASSAAVYGDTPTLPKREDMAPSPMSPYAVSKLAGEYYCSVFQRVCAVPTVCLRYFNIYGPRQDTASQYAAVIPRFISRLAQGQTPVIFGDGEQTRDFAFVKDAVAANIMAMERGVSGTFNIVGGTSIQINELARLTIQLLGSKVEPVYDLPRPGDIKHSLADISRARVFGYQPAYSLVEGLKETIDSLRHD